MGPEGSEFFPLGKIPGPDFDKAIVCIMPQQTNAINSEIFLMEKNANISKGDVVDYKIMRAHRTIVVDFIIDHCYNTGEFLYDGHDSYYTNKLFGIPD